MKLRDRIDVGNCLQRGDAIFAALAHGKRSIVLAIDEFPILANRLLKDTAGRMTRERNRETDAFLSRLRKAGQSHQKRITLILSGSESLEPQLAEAGLSAHANIFSPYSLQPWSEETAVACLEVLAGSCRASLPPAVCREMCRRLGCCIPHHVQMFFDRKHDHLRHGGREEAALEDVESVYAREMQGILGQVDLQHCEGRLRNLLGEPGYTVALEILTATAVEGETGTETIDRYRTFPSICLQPLNRADRKARTLNWLGNGTERSNPLKSLPIFRA